MGQQIVCDNLWLRNYLVRYNSQPHRSQAHSRTQDWRQNLPPGGLRAMCSFDRFRTFSREPERRKVGVDARVQTDGMIYEVAPELAGETVTLWWGLFDQELYVEHPDQRFGLLVLSTARSHCIAIAACANMLAMSGSSALRLWRKSWACRVRRWKKWRLCLRPRRARPRRRRRSPLSTPTRSMNCGLRRLWPRSWPLPTILVAHWRN